MNLQTLQYLTGYRKEIYTILLLQGSIREKPPSITNPSLTLYNKY